MLRNVKQRRKMPSRRQYARSGRTSLSRCSLIHHVCKSVTLHPLESFCNYLQPTPRILCSGQQNIEFPASTLSYYQDYSEWSLQASRVPASVLSYLYTSARPNLQRRPVHHYDMIWHGPYSSLVRSTGANARTQSLSQMRYQMATLISACMTGTWVGRYPLCHHDWSCRRL